ncbi:hypothetical protein AYR62_06840 [Secundilactobacillus paracollinoides]|uniref:Ribosomal processing cysteine protease Prp n=2 Tax=Secundilactobacillus paracollinoides TaxID=240427 RepID=A0A1B2J1C1_9LACO|nr:ribosomal-processing cysteine protease Prp [Secundilactobacillus paracollinoides]ANZ62145.1 hypothetical protein AYR61_12855 [Secundilactobacillus paracollinoides]ANZ63834.1 hypothetical protein AYR62_06840 [Secundilactobacillus paracollinoides]ANZ68092.1 hypothetical protein AYR63_13730 [Secundilactobacillus paracollinoides]
MIQATFDYDNSHRIIGFNLTGHADSAPYGSDIVCAAVSALSISAVNGLSTVAEITPVVVSKNDEGGFLSLRMPPVDDYMQDRISQALLQSFLNGLLDVEKQYSEYVRIS